MSWLLVKVLQNHKKKQTFRYGDPDRPEWVFITSTGTPIDEYNFRGRVFYKALKRAKLRHIRIHDLWHTYASHLMQRGVSMVYVKEQLGHHSIKMTVDVYGHLVPGGNREAVNRLDEGFDPFFCTRAAPELDLEEGEDVGELW